MRVLDLSQPLDERTVLWPGSTPFAAPGPEGFDEDGSWWRDLRTPEHAGTHLDAPVHYVPGGATVGDIPADRLVRPAVRIDARALCDGDPGWTLEAEHVAAWEADHGRVPADSAVLLSTGWDAFHRADPARYGGDPLAFPGYGAVRGAGCSSSAAWRASGSTRWASTPVRRPRTRCTTSRCPPGSGTSRG